MNQVIEIVIQTMLPHSGAPANLCAESLYAVCHASGTLQNTTASVKRCETDMAQIRKLGAESKGVFRINLRMFLKQKFFLQYSALSQIRKISDHDGERPIYSHKSQLICRGK